MSQSPTSESKERTNLFVSAIRTIDQGCFPDQLEPCDLAQGEVLIESNEPISQVYFPINCVISQVIPLEDQRNIEGDTVGYEGFIGVPVALDSQQTLRCVVQVPGQAFRLEANLFRNALKESQDLRRLVNHYVLAKLQQFAQSVACNAVHEVRQRLCRWLLTCQDRVGSNDFSLTQKFLAQMLGVRRPTVSDVAARLQADDLITYQRGRLTILNREGLETASCVCYKVIKREYERLLD